MRRWREEPRWIDITQIPFVPFCEGAHVFEACQQQHQAELVAQANLPQTERSTTSRLLSATEAVYYQGDGKAAATLVRSSKRRSGH